MTSQNGNAVNHPKHYNSHPAQCDGCGKHVECIEIVRHMGFNTGNILKYLWRAGLKDSDDIVDLEKALWYLEDEINQRKAAKAAKAKRGAPSA